MEKPLTSTYDSELRSEKEKNGLDESSSQCSNQSQYSNNSSVYGSYLLRIYFEEAHHKSNSFYSFLSINAMFIILTLVEILSVLSFFSSG